MQKVPHTLLERMQDKHPMHKKTLQRCYSVLRSPGRARTYNNPVNSRVLCH